MENESQMVKSNMPLYGIKGWLIVFVVFLPVNLILPLIQIAASEYALFSALITLVFTPLIMVFLFRKKIVFRLLFVLLMGVDLGFCMGEILINNTLADLYYNKAPLVFLIITLCKLLFFTIYLFCSKRVNMTFTKKPGTLSGAASAFLVFIISFLVVNIISLLETSLYTSRQIMLFNQIPFISAIMAYVIPIILSGVVIFLIIKRSLKLKAVFIAMMLAQASLLFLVFSYFGKGTINGYELYSYSLPMNVPAQCAYAFLSLIGWSIVLYKSKGIKTDFR